MRHPGAEQPPRGLFNCCLIYYLNQEQEIWATHLPNSLLIRGVEAIVPVRQGEGRGGQDRGRGQGDGTVPVRQVEGTGGRDSPRQKGGGDRGWGQGGGTVPYRQGDGTGGGNSGMGQGDGKRGGDSLC